jgi:general secretion pathway protein J
MRRIRDRIAFRLDRRGADAGLSLIELLISLMLLVLITGFLAGGVAIGRRAFSADQQASMEAANHAALASLANLIATALPNRSGQGAPISFEGGRDSLAFVALSIGHALPGGPLGVRIYRDGSEVDVVVKGGRHTGTAQDIRAQALVGVSSLAFSYFGSLEPSKPPAWHLEWPASDHLPDLVAIKVGFSGRRLKAPLLVALRQS